MRILLIGGTRFVGRHVVDAALAAGHDVTIFHRGQTGPDLFPDVEHRHRRPQLRPVGTGRGQLGRDGRHLRLLSRGRCTSSPTRSATGPVTTSSCPACRPTHRRPPRGYRRGRAAGRARRPDRRGGHRARPTAGSRCCASARRSSGSARGTVIVRPTYVVGPDDYTWRFPWWVARIARGGEVLAPGPADAPSQVIDARDMGAWMVGLLERGESGAFHAVGPSSTVHLGRAARGHRRCGRSGGHDTAWVDAAFLDQAEVDDADAAAVERRRPRRR